MNLSGGLSFAMGDELEARRIKISLAIFPRIVAVDEDIDRKLDAHKHVQLVVAYGRDTVTAQGQASVLMGSVQNIGGRPLVVQVLPVNSLSNDNPATVSGLFIAEKLEDGELERVLQFARQRHIIVFSPFSGDVERGVTAGIAVGSQVKPYFNLAALKLSGVAVNPTLLRISKHYE